MCFVYKSALKNQMLGWAIGRLRKTPPRRLPSVPALMLFAAVWGNYGYSGTVRLLRHICRTMRKRDGANVLECGSGASTLLLGVLAERYNCRVFSLEHDAAWAIHMAALTRRFELKHVQVLHAPLRSYGEYEWYSLPPVLQDPTFSVVVCDGPPASTRGGRFGLLPVAGQRLREDCIILLDDTHRRAERYVMARWSIGRSISVRAHLALKSFTEIAFVS